MAAARPRRARSLRGGCLCGAVSFVAAAPTPIELCHCPRCRKAYGGAFAATCYVRATDFRWTRGARRVATYEAPVRERPPGYRHAFCRDCGSPLPIVDRRIGFAEIPAGALDGDPGVRPLRHIFTARQAPWYAITDQLPRYDAHVDRSEHLAVALLPPRRRRG